MDERMFAQLANWLRDGPVVVCSVGQTQGATPRKSGSRMLVSSASTSGSIGGGLAEARVLARARSMLDENGGRAILDIDLAGQEQSAGICGGRMRIALRRLAGEADRLRVVEIASALQSGHRVPLPGEWLGDDIEARVAVPDVRLIVAGAGHCGAALCELAAHLDFEICVFDSRSELLRGEAFARVAQRSDQLDAVSAWLQTGRSVQAVLLNRNFEQDIALLRVLCVRPPRFFGMLGSPRRIAEVRRALPEFQVQLQDLVAPIGLAIGAQTPHEIAVSILAQLIEQRRGC